MQLLTGINSIYCEIIFIHLYGRAVIAITVIMLLLQFRLWPPGLPVPLRSHSARLIGNRDSKNVDDAAKRGSDRCLVHLITRTLAHSPGYGGTTEGQDASVFWACNWMQQKKQKTKLSDLKGACMIWWEPHIRFRVCCPVLLCHLNLLLYNRLSVLRFYRFGVHKRTDVWE